MPEQRSEYLFKRAKHKVTGRTGLITCAYENLEFNVLLTVRCAERNYINSPIREWEILGDRHE